MPLNYNYQISKGLEFLLLNQKSDGGVSATMPGDPSGCWTTASTLECFIKSGVFEDRYAKPLNKMINFLLGNQKNTGGWPTLEDSHAESTMATGHAVLALTLSLNFFELSNTRRSKIQRAITKGRSWLRDTINTDGGWSYEGKSNVDEESNVISTFYGLQGLIANGQRYANSAQVRAAIDFFAATKNSNSAWGARRGSNGDPCNTARAIELIILSEALDVVSIEDSVNFLVDCQDLWRIDVEAYVKKQAAGQVVFNSNTPCDVLRCLLISCPNTSLCVDLADWFAENQEPDGRWYLGDSEKKNPTISTWSTSEAITVLGMATSSAVMQRDDLVVVKQSTDPNSSNGKTSVASEPSTPELDPSQESSDVAARDPAVAIPNGSTDAEVIANENASTENEENILPVVDTSGFAKRFGERQKLLRSKRTFRSMFFIFLISAALNIALIYTITQTYWASTWTNLPPGWKWALGVFGTILLSITANLLTPSSKKS